MEELDEFNVEVQFCDAATVSAAYAIMSRCGINASDYIGDEDLQSLFDFNTFGTVNALGNAVSEISEQVLREIEVTVKNHERVRATERSAEHGTTGINNQQPADIGQIRNHAAELPTESSQNSVQSNGVETGTVSASSGNRQDSERTVRTDDERIDGERPAAGQSQESDGVGTAHEQSESDSGGVNLERPDIQLTEDTEQTEGAVENTVPSAVTAPVSDATSLSSVYHDLLTSGIQEDKTVINAAVNSDKENTIVEIKSLAEMLPEPYITLDGVNTILRQGGNQNRSVLRIAAQCMKGKSSAENAAFLKNEYRKGGRGIDINGQKLSAWFDETGMTFGDTKSALDAFNSVHFSWEQIESHIRQLIYNGQYIPQDKLDAAMDNERNELASSLLLLHRDLEDGLTYYFDKDVWHGGFPDAEKRVVAMLKQPEKLREIVSGLRKLCDDYKENRDILRFHFYKPNEIYKRLTDLLIEPITFTEIQIPDIKFTKFITEDEINAFLTRGGNIESSKFRIFSYFLHDHTSKELADFLKKEYGNGGGSHALSGIDNVLDGMAQRRLNTEENLASVKAQLETAKSEMSEPFAREQEFTKKTARLSEITIALKMDKKERELVDVEPDEADASTVGRNKSDRDDRDR